MFLTCEGTFGMVPATMDYSGDARPAEFQTGHQEIEGINLGYLQINGTQMFALAQVLSDLFKDIPRTTISKKMETLKIKSRRCDLRELRTLKAIRSLPTRAVKCSLISKADLEALCTSCKSLSPRRRKRKRREQRRLLPGPADLFDRPRQPPRSPCGAGPYCPQEPGICPERAPAPHPAPAGLFPSYDKAARGRKGYSLGARGELFAGVFSAYPRDLQLLHAAAAGAHGAGQASHQPEPGRPKRLFPEEQGPGAARKGRLFPGSKRQGTSAGYSSDSDSSLDFGGSSPATSSDSSEEEEGDTSCSSEEGSSSESESSSLCSGDSVQSTRYRQAALPRFQPLPHPPREPSADERLPEPHRAAPRPDPNLLLLSQQLWARTLRASTLESLRPLPALGAGAHQPPPEPRSSPVGDPQQKAGGCGEAEPRAKAGDLHKAASNNAASLGPSDQAERQPAALAGRPASQEPALGSAPPPSAQEGGLGEPRREHFDRLIRQSKLWCYAKGFNADGKSLRPGGRPEPGKAAELQCPSSKSAASPRPWPDKALKGSGSERNPKRSRLARGAEAERPQNSAKGRPQKTPRRNAQRGKAPPGRNSFSLMGNFPCTPSLVVGEDGDLRPAASLCVKNSCALSKTHPLWSWQVGGSALPVPPSLKFRGWGLEGF
ncbi:elongin BC and Polycomb repressive complex 2-associated protein [Chelydra serpentina]|uniref:Elongin BC and Polycomb repressive complex 2-associated protein n=1 Tax=Chelydra serpentina TaxID=8475 RepID=A0A8T1TBL7_CHESE|nr:elongin BC and Polycomb repressive complex 2-associated protein [Chelydra serpentina]